jgi:hypothetical protein
MMGSDSFAEPVRITPEVSQKLKEMNPYFFSYQDLSPELKALARRRGIMCMIEVPKGERVVFPNGMIFEADGSHILPNGLKIVPSDINGELTVKYVRPDGTGIKEGETFTGSDGLTLYFSNGGFEVVKDN